MTGDPVISVVIPVWNREASIERTLRSLPQDFGDAFEVIVVDDGSTDRSRAIAETALRDRPNGYVIHQANAGPGAARNAGAARARGDYIAFLDSDDYWFEWSSESCLEAIAMADRPALFFLRNLDFPAGTMPPPGARHYPILKHLSSFAEAVRVVPDLRFATCNVLVRRNVFDAVGGFATAIRYSEDTDLFLRIPPGTGCTVISAPAMVAHEIGGDGLTGDFDSVRAGVEFLLRGAAQGRYPVAGDAGERDRAHVMAQVICHFILRAFAAGHVGTAYAWYFRNIPLLLRGREWHWIVRLPLLPALHLLRPSNFAFRWRPAQLNACKATRKPS